MTQESLELTLPEQRQAGADGQQDTELEQIYSWFRTQRNYVQRFGEIFRKSIDEVLDGQRTGRYDLYIKEGERRVEKTEKTYLGTKVEIVAREEFDLGYGEDMDYSISGIEVDAKWTIGNTWTIPKEAMGHICLVMHADDRTRHFKVGLVRITQELLNAGENGDSKRTISAAEKKQIRWIIEDGTLPKNFLLTLEKENAQQVKEILAASDGYKGSGNGGQRRVNALFEKVPGLLVDRTTVVTVARQDDGPKRVRDARKHLRSEGFVVLGHLKPAPQVASDLGLPIPDKGSWVSAKLTLVADGDDRQSTVIGGQRYGLWQEGDACIEAPLIGSDSEAS
ncbi:NaeI family type II restriction endonuclease [Streptomyces sp. NPDC048603]|uniref:NaeI family type II restriction endonuclease n=1 Tax=Streptomyces sp. NPDC048603 TaxID=3365577 RepID=UPI0037195BA2